MFRKTELPSAICAAQARAHCLFCALVYPAPFFILNVCGARWQDRSPMHTFDFVRFCKVRQVPADRLQSDVELIRQRLDTDLAVAAQDFKNVSLSEALGHSIS